MVTYSFSFILNTVKISKSQTIHYFPIENKRWINNVDNILDIHKFLLSGMAFLFESRYIAKSGEQK